MGEAAREIPQSELQEAANENSEKMMESGERPVDKATIEAATAALAERSAEASANDAVAAEAAKADVDAAADEGQTEAAAEGISPEERIARYKQEIADLKATQSKKNFFSKALSNGATNKAIAQREAWIEEANDTIAQEQAKKADPEAYKRAINKSINRKL